MTSLYHNIIYVPLYNGLVFLIGILPSWAGVGFAIILFTIIVKFILYPLSKSTLKTQLKMKVIEPKMKAIREKHKGDNQAMSMATLQMYKEEGVNPFVSFFSLFLILIQLPILFALYRIFYLGGLPNVHTDLLYSFVTVPSVVSMSFLGINIAGKSLILALGAGAAQFFQMRYSFAQNGPVAPTAPGAAPDMAATMASMQTQMKYIFPIMMVIIGYTVNAGIAIYLITSSLFMLAQEIIMRRGLAKNSQKALEKN